MGMKPNELAQLRANLERGAAMSPSRVRQALGLPDDAPSPAGVKRRPSRKPVVVKAERFCIRCGSYDHREDDGARTDFGDLLRADCSLHPGMRAEPFVGFAVAVRTENVANGSHGTNPFAENGRRDRVKHAIREGWKLAGIRIKARYRVTLTRISAGALDDDNLRLALKSARDSIAACIGIDDKSPIVEWAYQQEIGAKGLPAVRIEVDTL